MKLLERLASTLPRVSRSRNGPMCRRNARVIYSCLYIRSHGNVNAIPGGNSLPDQKESTSRVRKCSVVLLHPYPSCSLHARGQQQPLEQVHSVDLGQYPVPRIHSKQARGGNPGSYDDNLETKARSGTVERMTWMRYLALVLGCAHRPHRMIRLYSSGGRADLVARASRE